jgi:hypothetical protein
MTTEELEAVRLNRRVRLFMVRSGIPILFLMFGGLIFAGFIVPIPPSNNAAAVVAQYTEDNFRIKAGLVISFMAVIFLLAFGAGIAGMTKTIKGVPSALISMQTAAYAAGSLIFVIPWIMWQTAAYRLDRAPNEIMLLNDLGWMSFVFPYIAFTAWNFAIAACIFCDRAETPVYPRWMGYFNIFVGLSFVPDQFIPFFKTGVFAWNGLIPYWIPFVIYGIWILLTTIMSVKAIRREEAEEAAALGRTDAIPAQAPVPTAGA